MKLADGLEDKDEHADGGGGDDALLHEHGEQDEVFFRPGIGISLSPEAPSSFLAF